MRERRRRVIKQHVLRTHGQCQRGEGLRVGQGKVVAGKWRQLYLNNNKNIK